MLDSDKLLSIQKNEEISPLLLYDISKMKDYLTFQFKQM